MRFLLDQSTDARLQTYLHGLGHDAIRVGRELPHSIPDTDVLAHAAAAKRVLITDDRDFGELVFRHRQPHTGVIFLRLGPDAGLSLMTARLTYVLDHYADRLDEFPVVTREDVRIRRRLRLREPARQWIGPGGRRRRLLSQQTTGRAAVSCYP